MSWRNVIQWHLGFPLVGVVIIFAAVVMASKCHVQNVYCIVEHKSWVIAKREKTRQTVCSLMKFFLSQIVMANRYNRHLFVAIRCEPNVVMRCMNHVASPLE